MSAATVSVRARIGAAVGKAVASLLNSYRASGPRDAGRQPVALEALETRILFGYWGLYGPPLVNGCCPTGDCQTCPTPIFGGGGGGGGGFGGGGGGGLGGGGSGTGRGGGGGGQIVGTAPGQTAPIGNANGATYFLAANTPAGAGATESPITAFTGMPVITSTDLQANVYGLNWGVQRSWVGMNDTGPVGNGWSISQLPYLVVAEASYSYSPPPHNSVLLSAALPDDHITLVEGGNAGYSFVISPPTGDTKQYNNFASLNGQPYTLVSGTDGSTNVLRFTDATGDVTEFYDVKRDSGNSNRPIPWTYGTANTYGLFHKYTAANGTSVTANYTGSQLTSEVITSSNPNFTASEQYVFAYTPTSGAGAVTNSLVAGAGGTVPQLVSTITLQEKASSTDSWHNVRAVSYTYYKGDGTDNTTPTNRTVNVNDGRLGDLELVTITDSSGNIINQDYYRYYKMTGDQYDAQEGTQNTRFAAPPSPTNNPGTTGGGQPIQLAWGDNGQQGGTIQQNPYADNMVFTGLKTVVQGASYDRLAAAEPNFQTQTDALIQPYINNFFTYERWDDHVGADGPPGFGAAGYQGANDIQWQESYFMGTRYRVTEEIAQGAGCSSCSQGQGTYAYEYAANYNTYADGTASSNGGIDMGYNTIEYNVWRMKTTEVLPDGNLETIYSNEVGQPMLDVFAQMNSAVTAPISGMTAAQPTGNFAAITVNINNSNNTFQANQYVALSGVLPELYNGVFKIVSANTTSFTFDLNQNYYGSSGARPPTPFAGSTTSPTTTPAPGRVTLTNSTVTLVTNQWETYYRYDDEGHLIETAQPSAVTGFDDSTQDLVDTSTTPLGFISANSGLVSISQYSGWNFDGRAGVTTTNSHIVGDSIAFPNGDNNAAFIGDTSYISQNVLVSSSGNYTLSFNAADANLSNEQLQVWVDGQPRQVSFNGNPAAVTFSPQTAAFEGGTATLTLTPGPHTISFVGDGTAASSGYSLVTDVTLSSVGIADGNFVALNLTAGTYQMNPQQYLMGTGSTAVVGDLAATYVQQGQQGTAIEQQSFTYTSNTTNGVSVFPIASQTVYGGTGAGDAPTTTYTYQFFTGTNLIQKETMSAPPISSTQNGPGPSSPDTTTTFFDQLGNATWTMDGAGFITYNQYDPFTGGLLKHISDVNTNDTGDFSGLPSGWTTPTGGGLELVTTYTVDALGRPTSMTDPNEQTGGPDAGYSTQYVYIDGKTNGYVNQVFVYPGWHSTGGGNFTTMGPVQVSREYRGGNILSSAATSNSSDESTLTDSSLSSTGWYIGLTLTVTTGMDAGQSTIVTGYNSSTHQLTFAPALPHAIASGDQYTLSTPVYDETLTFTAPTDSTSTPNGSESVSASNIQSLSRGLTNNAGQLIEQDDYASLSGLTYSATTAILASATPGSTTGSGNYSATQYGYDDRGRLDRTVDPNGTITRTVYDGQGRPISTWIGTNDTPASGEWSPTNNTSPANMVDIEDMGYDTQSAPDQPVLSSGTLNLGSAHSYYVQITYVYTDANGARHETAPSLETNFTSNFNLVVNPPAAPPTISGVIGFNVYVGQNYGTEALQNSSPISLSGNWTEPTGGLLTGTATPPTEGIGDGLLTRTVQHAVTSYDGTNDDRVTEQYYDWRHRLVLSDITGQGTDRLSTMQLPVYFYQYDNLGELTETDQYHETGLANFSIASLGQSGGVPNAPAASLLVAKSTSAYDDQGRVYVAKTYSVDPNTGSVGNALSTNTVYDHRGNVIATFAPGGQVTKDSYDGAGRLIKESTTEGGVINGAVQPGQNGGWTAASSTAADIVVEQMLYTYDGDGNVIETNDRQRFDTDPTTSSGEGDLAGPSGNNLASRDYYSANYYDAAERLTDQVNVGTNAGTAWPRPGTVPPDSSTVLVTHTEYDDGGSARDTVDPRGVRQGNFYDLLGRTLDTIGNWDDKGSAGSLPTAGNSSNQIVSYVYDGNGDVFSMTAIQPAGGSTPNQTTEYEYGVPILNNNDLLYRIDYPDPTTGQPSTNSAQQQRFLDDGMGDTEFFFDQNGTEHYYIRDVTGRVQSDTAASLGSGVDGSVRQLGYTYTGLGLPYQQTSYSDTSGTNVLNQVQDVYNGFGQLLTQYQEHNGAVNTGSSLKVQYSYDQSNNDSRLVSMTYPNGRILDYAYGTVAVPIVSISSSGTTATATLAGNDHLSAGDKVLITGSATSQYDGTFTVASASTSSFTFTLSQSFTGSDSSADISALDTSLDPLDNAISRPDALIDHGGNDADFLQRYTYLGLSTVVQATDSSSFAAGAPALSYINRGQGSVNTDGGDRYTGLDRFGRVIDQYWFNTSGTTDRFQYAYDQNGNVLYKNNLVNSSFSELYHANGVATNSSYDNLNRLTNFARGTLSSSGNNGTMLDQITSPSATNNWNLDALGNWTGTGSQTRTFNAQNQIMSISGLTTPGYDNNGNMTKDQAGNTYTYNAWNQIAKFNGYTYSYDALGRRTNEGTSSRDLYYDANNANVIEERQSSTVKDQNVWGLMYVNQLVLRDDNSTSGNYGITGSGLGERLYAQQDADWNVTALVSPTGAVQERFVYDPYGARTVLSPTWGSASDSFGWVYNFQDGRTDSVTGLVHFDVRDLNTVTGAWMQQDPNGSPILAPPSLSAKSPLAYAPSYTDTLQTAAVVSPVLAQYIDGLDLYRYEVSNPARSADPTGEITVFFSGATRSSGDQYNSGVGKMYADPWFANNVPGGRLCATYRQVDWAIAAIKRAKAANPSEPVILVGHSWGGSAANDVAQQLGNDGINVDLEFTIDPVTSRVPTGPDNLTVPPNVNNAINVYNPDAGATGGTIVNGAVNIPLPNTTHTTISDDPRTSNILKSGLFWLLHVLNERRTPGYRPPACSCGVGN